MYGVTHVHISSGVHRYLKAKGKLLASSKRQEWLTDNMMFGHTYIVVSLTLHAKVNSSHLHKQVT